MTTKFIEKNAYGRAYAAWFSEYERERKKQKKRCGAHLSDFPAEPTNPEYIAQAIDTIGSRRVIKELGVHRSTVARWLSGQCVIPRPCWLLLVIMAEGRLPGMSTDWQQWRFDGDRLSLVGTRQSYTAREIAGWPYQLAYADALSRQISSLEAKIQYLLRVGDFEAQNDALMNTR